jgi:hypothetical protein
VESITFLLLITFAFKDALCLLKGQCHEIQVFYESSSPKPLKITLGSFRIFQNKFAEIFNDTSGEFATGVNDTGGAP